MIKEVNMSEILSVVLIGLSSGFIGGVIAWFIVLLIIALGER